MTTLPPIVVVFAASDPTAGAGLQADLLALAAHGCHGATIVTAVTVQDTHGVHAVRAVDAAEVEAQARVLLAEFPVTAFKLGVLANAAQVGVVARMLARWPNAPLVLDPVLASARGDALAGDEVAGALCAQLLPRAAVITPNSLEARRLAGRSADADLAECARSLARRGARYVLVTGTHEATPEVENTLYDVHGVVRSDRWPRLPGSYHGSGCTLASAIAAQLARGRDVPAAVGAAQDYTWRALRAAFRPAGGQWIPQRLVALTEAAP
jgi:hydroxymethylpyrimidine/phosphomethylpyrimidine kinase